jgi:hypothetical protein
LKSHPPKGIFMADLFFLPQPRVVTRHAGTRMLPLNGVIVLGDPSLLFEAQALQAAFARADRDYPVAAVSADEFAVRLRVDPALGNAESYRLSIADAGIEIVGADHAGVWYGFCTLRQILQQAAPELPLLEITDAPDFPQRGVMLDVSRDKVPTMDTLYALIDRLAGWKINHLELYFEHAFAYPSHPEVWRDASPFTPQEILELDAFCRQRHIDLVPNQNSLGHMERWLKHPRYAPLAESPDGFVAWGGHRPPSSLNPLDPGSIALIASLYDELLPHFTSPFLNVGGDEPWELGQGRSAAECERIGLGRVYLNYLLALHAEVTKRGKTMMMWDDIIVQYPELIPELPRDVIAMIWGYEADHPFEERCKAFLNSDIPFYVCPGTSSWNTFTARWDNMIANQRGAAENGLKYGARGVLNTDWGDSGHTQSLPASYPGWAYGAALAWGVETNRDIDLPAVLDRFAFEDRAGVMGALMQRLGQLYLRRGQAEHNGHMLVRLLKTEQAKLAEIAEKYVARGHAPEAFADTLADLDACAAELARAQMQRPDAALVQREIALAIDLLRHAARQAQRALGVIDTSWNVLAEEQAALIARYRAVWLARNRPGGLNDSVARFPSRADD